MQREKNAESKEGIFESQFKFEGNVATVNIGNDILVSSLKPCIGLCSNKLSVSNLDVTPKELFSNSCTGNFVPDPPEFATEPVQVFIAGNTYGNITELLFPGIVQGFDIKQIDEGNNSVGDLFPLYVKVVSESHQVSVQDEFMIITNNEVALLGTLEANGTLIFETSAHNALSTDIQFVFGSNCPPGFYFNQGVHACECAMVNGTSKYTGIAYCEKNFAYLSLGYWAGYTYVPDNPNIPVFVTGRCATILCNFGKNFANQSLNPLPSFPNQLSSAVCSEGRKGMLCGECIDGLSTYFNSPTFTCHNATDGCPYGIPLYIVSDLLPVTLLFLIILLFNISLTSGALYSFVFFAQFIDVLYINAFSTIVVREDSFCHLVLNILQAIYGIFNLHTISTKLFAFCIIKKATVMDIFMFKYLTVLYSLILVVFVLVILRVNCLQMCLILCRRWGRRNVSGSVIKGLSAFLVLCYSQCSLLTARILSSAQIFKEDVLPVKLVPLFNGNLQYLQGSHLWYSLPGLICFIFIILPPIVVLLLEPLLVAISNSGPLKKTAFQFIVRRARLKIKPFLDSFQGCFKNRWRFFAGMYFLYRTVVPLLSLSSKSTIETYIISTLLLTFILLTHSIFCPFQKKWHNIVDVAILTNHIAINILTIVNYYTYIEGTVDGISVNTVIWVQILLLSLPLFFICIYVGTNMYFLVTNRHSEYAERNIDQIFSQMNLGSSIYTKDGLSIFPPRMLQEEGLLESNIPTPSYQTF